MKSFYEWYRKHITGAIFGGLILGILTGLFLAGRFKVVLTATSVLGSIYMSALNMMIFPLVFCSIVMGIASIGSARTTGKITGAAMLFFLCTTALASFVGLIIPRLIRLGKGVSFKMATSDIGGGMLPKIQNCIDAIENGVSRVHILDGRIPHCLLLEIFTNKGIGTAIKNDIEERYYYGE